jgi:PemK-like, MazF-like toxin of type II toxin-antitoxin system
VYCLLWRNVLQSAYMNDVVSVTIKTELDIVSVSFPFFDKPTQAKARPGLALISPLSKHRLIIAVYISTQVDEVLESDIVLDTNDREFAKTGLKHSSVIRLHKISSVVEGNVGGQVGVLPMKWEQEVKAKLRQLFDL